MKEEELKDEERVQRELKELQEQEIEEKDRKKRKLGDIMEKYHENERDKMSIMKEQWLREY